MSVGRGRHDKIKSSNFLCFVFTKRIENDSNFKVSEVKIVNNIDSGSILGYMIKEIHNGCFK